MREIIDHIAPKHLIEAVLQLFHEQMQRFSAALGAYIQPENEDSFEESRYILSPLFFQYYKQLEPILVAFFAHVHKVLPPTLLAVLVDFPVKYYPEDAFRGLPDEAPERMIEDCFRTLPHSETP